MKKNIYNLILTIFLSLFLNSYASAEIKFKEVVVTGIGQSLEEATNNAFAEAISMVNGKNVQTKTIIKVLSGYPIPKEMTENQENVNFFAKILVQLQDDSSASKKTTEPKKEEKEDGKPKYSQKYIKELIDETKGGIKSYKILKKK